MRKKTKNLAQEQIWLDMKKKGKNMYILSEFKRDVILGFMLGVIMHYRVGMSMIEYFKMDFLVRAIIYTSIYSIGGMFHSRYTWSSLKKKYN